MEGLFYGIEGEGANWVWLLVLLRPGRWYNNGECYWGHLMATSGPTVARPAAGAFWSEWLAASGQTRGLIVRIDAATIHYHRLEHNPPWGTHRAASDTFDKWGRAPVSYTHLGVGVNRFCAKATT